MLGDMNVEVALLTGSVTKKKREPILENLVSGKLQIIIGTHGFHELIVVNELVEPIRNLHDETWWLAAFFRAVTGAFGTLGHGQALSRTGDAYVE